MQQAIELSAEELQRRMWLVSRVLRPLAHQFANDVTFLATTFELLRAHTLPAPLTTVVQQASDYAQEVCAELRRAAYTATPAPPEGHEPVRVAAAFDDVGAAVPGVDGRLRVECPSGLWALAHRPSLVAGLSALIVNSAEAGASHIGLMAAMARGRVLVTVHDDGPGFKDGFLEDALVPFITSKALPHRGIGLSAVQAMAAGHGSTLRIVSSEAGTRVEVDLPFLSQPTPMAGEGTFSA